MKWVIRIGIAAGVVVILAVGGVWWYLDWLTQAAIEQGGQYATGTTTSVEEARVSPWAGRLGVEQVTIANPDLPGGGQFQSPHFLQLGEGRFALDWSSTWGETIRMPQLVLNDLNLQLERKGGTSNHQIILDRLKKLSGPDKKQPKDARKFVIDHVLVKNVSVTLRGYPGGRRTVKLAQPIELRDVGSNTQGGVVAAEVTGVILQSVFKQVLMDMAELPDVLTGELTDRLKQLEGLDRIGRQLLKDTGRIMPDIGEMFGGGSGSNSGGGPSNQSQGEGPKQNDGNPLRQLGEGVGDMMKGQDSQKSKQSGNE